MTASTPASTGTHRSTSATAFKRRTATLAGVLLLSGAAALLWREPLLLAVGDWLVVEDPLHPADIIHVISGPDNRTNYALELYDLGLGKQLFFTGGWCTEIQGNHAERGRRLAAQQGVPDAAIATDGTQVNSTYSEALRLKAFIDASPTPIHSVILVSEPHHMRRARWAYRYVLGDQIELQMAPVPFAFSSYHRRWWEDAGSTRMVQDEYIKFVYYLARYQFSSGPLQAWLASLDTD
jgi:uncharacterized SAM-binding protein YcdF (DUF218 family)